MPEYSEQDIIEGCQKNLRQFQELLYQERYSMFMKVCLRYARCPEDAEQLLHDGFLKIFTNICNYENKGSFEGWMRRIIVNNCIDYLKSKHFKRKDLEDLNDDFNNKNYSTGYANGLDNLKMNDIVQLIRSLPPTSQTVFNLFIFEGYSHKNIAEIMEISVGTSQWHVNNARKILQTKILELGLVENKNH